jgi:hypothetical protein
MVWRVEHNGNGYPVGFLFLKRCGNVKMADFSLTQARIKKEGEASALPPPQGKQGSV